MQYIKFTYIDADTGVSVAQQTANRLVMPRVSGLEFKWAALSEYPTPVPTFYGVCPDGSDTDKSGVIDILTEAEYTAAYTAEIAMQKELQIGEFSLQQEE